MTVGLIALLTSVVIAFVLGVFTGHWFSERRLAVRASRQAAAHTSIYRQLRELQVTRPRTDSVLGRQHIDGSTRTDLLAGTAVRAAGMRL